MTLEQFKNKVEWEGGVTGALDYGLTSSHLSDQARAENPEFVRAWDRMAASYATITAEAESIGL